MTNKSIDFATAVIATLAVAMPLAALADTPPASKPVCLQTYLIDHTQIQDDSTILFYMRGGKIWKNALTDKCVGLRMADGFVYEAQNNEICSNLQSIRLRREGNVCLLGEFTPYTPAPQPTH